MQKYANSIGQLMLYSLTFDTRIISALYIGSPKVT